MHITSTKIKGQDIYFAISNEKDYIQNYHLNGQFYEQNYLEMLAPYCDPGKAFVDIGANVGNHTVYASKFFDVSEVVPFECNPVAIDILRRNLALNNCDNVDVRKLGLALGAQVGFARIRNSAPNNLGGTQIEYGPSGADPAPGDIPVVTGDSALRHKPVGVLKIDVELTEFEVLAGLRQTIDYWRPVIMVEVVPERHEQLEAWCSANRYHIKMKGWDNLLLPEEHSGALPCRVG